MQFCIYVFILLAYTVRIEARFVGLTGARAPILILPHSTPLCVLWSVCLFDSMFMCMCVSECVCVVRVCVFVLCVCIGFVCVCVCFVLFFMCVSSWHCRRVWFDCARRNCVSMRVGFMVTLSCQTLPGNCVSMRFPDGAWTWSLCVVRLCQVIECQCVFHLLHGHSRLARCVDFAGNCVSTYMLFVFVSGDPQRTEARGQKT